MERQGRAVLGSGLRFGLTLPAAWGALTRGARIVPGLMLRSAIRVYQLLLSPVLPPACRFLPTCSDYAIEAIERHGAVRGGGMAIRRLMHCHPWGGGGYDPVPPAGCCRSGRLGSGQ